MFYRLKKGQEVRGHAGTGGARVFSANDPDNNVIESDEDLAGMEPERYEVFTGHLTDEIRQKAGFSNNPTHDVDVETLSPEQLEDESQRMIDRAAELKRIAMLKREEADRVQEEEKSTPVRKGKALEGTEPQKSVLQKVSKAPPKSEQEYKSMVDKLSLSDAKTHAKERNIDINGLTTREQIVEKIKSTPVHDDKE